ncbi:MAG: hypothetical protein IPF54_07960 [Draconibacterium sp.]|nr:hypothetical protein [Draconibacterium sp.]
MNHFLEKIKLIDHLRTELDIQKEEFVKILKSKVDEGDYGLLISGFDIFSSSKNEFKGYVDCDKFKIRKRRGFFDINLNIAIAKGSFIHDKDKLVITTDINSFSGIMIAFYSFAIFIYLMLIISFFASEFNEATTDDLLIIPFIIIHSTLMLGIPYLIMRSSTKRLKYDLEREFYYITKK